MHNNFIIKLIKLYKMINFDSQGGLTIEYAGSKIRFTKKGDIVVNAKRHTIHHRDLFFDGCDQHFIDTAITKNEQGKKQLENYVMGQNRSAEFTCELEDKKQYDGNKSR